MENLSRLELAEVVTLDAAQLSLLRQKLGPIAAEKTAHCALESIATRVGSIEAAWEAGEFQRLAKSARLLVGISEQVGMTSLVHVARDVAHLALARDDAALAAVVKRLVRTGDASLAAVCDAGATGV